MIESMVQQIARAFQPDSLQLKSGKNGEAMGQITGTFVFPGDLPLFSGHFPGNPVVPGVILVEICVFLLKKAHPTPPLRLTAVRQAKFSHIVLPDQLVRVHCHCHPEGSTLIVEAQVHVENDLAATIVLELSPLP